MFPASILLNRSIIYLCFCCIESSCCLQRKDKSLSFGSEGFLMGVCYCYFWGIFGTAVTYYLQAWTIAARGPLFSARFSPLTTVITTTYTFLLLHENLYIGR
ncbi:WAT1-related protein [Dioscorea alata]|uniref:WAT1-related protein n=1 Tax=Dioscorea alata TaxID=55571 RepID=A0ACB7VLN4_DIOAL|nr:WAT1-related protein [Dioscorea alata]